MNNQELGKNLKPIDWSKIKLEPFQKLFLKDEFINTKSEDVITKYRQENEIVIRDNRYPVPQPFITWEETFFPNYVQQCIIDAKYQQPTSIQGQCFPVILSGHDLIGIAKTGSGKTLAFLLPAIVHINAQPAIKKGDGPIALILAPTRELAMQIEEEAYKFGKTSNLKDVCVYGGADKYPQQSKLRQGVDIIIACPGRLIEFLENNVTNLKRVTYLVLDEADRMLDMGFEPQIRKITSQIRPDRQTLMFSATWPKQVQQLAQDLCQEQPIYIQIGSYEYSVNDHIKQIIEILNPQQKTDRLIKYLDSMMSTDKVLIFCQTKKGSETLSHFLEKETFKVMPIHGNKSQYDRDRAMDQFKQGKINILVATDVAQRGLDIKDITYVINYDCPKQIEDYIHRIGRTGRAGAYGTSITFLTYEEDMKVGKDIINILRECNQEIPKELLEMCEKKHRGRDDYRSYNPSNNYKQQQFTMNNSRNSNHNYNQDYPQNKGYPNSNNDNHSNSGHHHHYSHHDKSNSRRNSNSSEHSYKQHNKYQPQQMQLQTVQQIPSMTLQQPPILPQQQFQQQPLPQLQYPGTAQFTTNPQINLGNPLDLQAQYTNYLSQMMQLQQVTNPTMPQQAQQEKIVSPINGDFQNGNNNFGSSHKSYPNSNHQSAHKNEPEVTQQQLFQMQQQQLQQQFATQEQAYQSIGNQQLSLNVGTDQKSIYSMIGMNSDAVNQNGQIALNGSKKNSRFDVKAAQANQVLNTSLIDNQQN